ncbi:hypothetical protein ES705_06824 [subsurface metagenome]
MKTHGESKNMNPRKKVRNIEQEKFLFMNAANLHDVFMNASLCYSHMNKYPVKDDAEEFIISRRGRFERLWITFLFVLIEAWQSKSMSSTRDYIASFVSEDVAEVERLIQKAEEDSSLTKIRAVRDYMCHRDRREYWDEGRIAVVGQLICNEEIFLAFRKMFLNYVESNKPREKDANRLD